MNQYLRCLAGASVLVLLLLQAACVASHAPKVQCDSNLTPINPQSVAKP